MLLNFACVDLCNNPIIVGYIGEFEYIDDHSVHVFNVIMFLRFLSVITVINIV